MGKQALLCVTSVGPLLSPKIANLRHPAAKTRFQDFQKASGPTSGLFSTGPLRSINPPFGTNHDKRR